MSPAARRPAPPGFGLIIIGSEILDGRRADRHFEACRRLLMRKKIPLTYSLILKDDPALITRHLETAFGREEPFFCCGGIGGTPDDFTRGCAADALGLTLETHPEGEQILRARWGDAVDEPRLRMVLFPAGAELIPNPINQVPGFMIEQGHFVPGFPDMARAMMIWVLRTRYEGGQITTRHSLVLPGAREADLSDMMETLVGRFPDVAFSSLPAYTETGTHVELSVAGLPEHADAALRFLKDSLDASGVTFVSSPA